MSSIEGVNTRLGVSESGRDILLNPVPNNQTLKWQTTNVCPYGVDCSSEHRNRLTQQSRLQHPTIESRDQSKPTQC